MFIGLFWQSAWQSAFQLAKDLIDAQVCQYLWSILLLNRPISRSLLTLLDGRPVPHLPGLPRENVRVSAGNRRGSGARVW